MSWTWPIASVGWLVLLGLACRPGLPLCSSGLAGPVQHFRSAVFNAWRDKVAADGFRGDPLLDIFSCQGKRDKGRLRSVMVGGDWNGYLLGRVKGQPVLCRFCGAPDGDGHLFWKCTFPPLVEIRENPEFHDLMIMDKGH